MPDYGKLTITLAGGQRQEFALSKSEISIGRAATSDIQLSDTRASRAHTRIECGPEGCFAVDLGSVNGTKVNGAAVQRALLATGDKITIGASTLIFGAPADADDSGLTRLENAADIESSILRASLTTRIGETSRPRLAIHCAGRTWQAPLDAALTTIGRRADNDIVIESPKASRFHARIERTAAGFAVEDLNSDNGTWIGQERISRHVLADGDTIRIGGARLIYKAGFVEEDLTMLDFRPRSGVRRPVIVVPGYLGSTLYLGSEQLWPNTKALFSAASGLVYGEGQPELEARSVVDEMVIVPNLVKLERYGRLTRYLEEALGYQMGKDLMTFPYDFRQDVRLSARRLAQAIEDWRPGAPVTIIAHSMGSLVSRHYVDRLGGHRRVERLVMLGGPQAGAPETIVHLVLGSQLLPFGMMAERLRDLVLSHPGVYQLLPSYPCGEDQNGCPVDWLNDSSWLPEKARPLLKNAAEFWRDMRPKPAVPALCIFGYGLKTVSTVRLERGPDGLGVRVEPATDRTGDGTVPERSAVLEGAEIHPVEQYHGSLHADNDVKKRLKVELTR
ncbi:MAG TPA: FHA domain-containing protein [Verrucomicrobiae bacterium]|nr:FHA domain-containing protein [Verrucomicrobiae bacterium]